MQTKICFSCQRNICAILLSGWNCQWRFWQKFFFMLILLYKSDLLLWILHNLIKKNSWLCLWNILCFVINISHKLFLGKNNRTDQYWQILLKLHNKIMFFIVVWYINYLKYEKHIYKNQCLERSLWFVRRDEQNDMRIYNHCSGTPV